MKSTICRFVYCKADAAFCHTYYCGHPAKRGQYLADEEPECHCELYVGLHHGPGCNCDECAEARRAKRAAAYNHLRGEDSVVDGYSYADFHISGPTDIEKLFWELTERVKVGQKFEVRVIAV